MYKKILLAYDGRRAAENAIQIAKCSSDSIVDIVYVVDASKAKNDVLSN